MANGQEPSKTPPGRNPAANFYPPQSKEGREERMRPGRQAQRDREKRMRIAEEQGLYRRILYRFALVLLVIGCLLAYFFGPYIAFRFRHG